MLPNLIAFRRACIAHAYFLVDLLLCDCVIIMSTCTVISVCCSSELAYTLLCLLVKFCSVVLVVYCRMLFVIKDLYVNLAIPSGRYI